jgi:hypothetical protein
MGRVVSYDVNVFISHSWSYSGHYDTISEWLCDGQWNVDGTPLRFVDYSVPRHNPIHYAPNAQALRAAIYERIAGSHVVVIPTGVYATYSNWIGKEIDGAKLYGKPIVAVTGWGAERESTVVTDAAAETVGWQKQSVVNAVWGQFWRRR